MSQKPLPDPPQMRNSGLPPTHLPSPSHSPGFLLFKWEQPPEHAPGGDWWLNFPEWWHALCHEDWCVPACHEDHVGTMLQWLPEWPHPSVLQQEQATHFMQWKRAAGGHPITKYQRGATEGEYLVWKWTLDNVVESAWAQHHQATHNCQEAAAACACQEAARRQQLLDKLKEDGLLYATCLFAQCVAEDHRAGLLFAKRLFAWCVAEDQWLAERRTQAR
jgi:hypothetical protein